MRYSISYKLRRPFISALLLVSWSVLTAQSPARRLSIDELFRLGTENSLQLKAAKIEEIISDNQRKGAYMNQYPTIQIGIDGGIIGQPIIFRRGLTHPTRPQTPDWSQNYKLELTQPIYQGGKIRYTIRKTDLQNQIAGLNTTHDQADLKLTLLQSYVNLFAYYKQQEVLARNIEESERRLKDIRRMHKEGLVTRNDEIRSELELTNDRLAYQEVGNSIAILSQQLDIWLGWDETQLICPDTTLLYQSMGLQTYEAYVQLAYENYPDLQIVRKQVRLAENELKLTKADYLPHLSLHAGNTLNRPFGTPLTDLYTTHWNIELSLSYHLSSLYQNKHRVREAQQIIRLRHNAVEQQEQAVRLQIKSAYIRHTEAVERVKALQLSVEQAQENYRIVRNRYLNQLSILTDLLDASSVRLEAELQLTIARSQAVYTYYELQRACGNL